MGIKDIKQKAGSVFKSIWSFSVFFRDKDTYSMTKLLSFIITLTICFDAIWTLTVFKQPWDFTLEKMIFGVTAFSIKVGALLVENWASMRNPANLKNVVNEVEEVAGKKDDTVTDTDSDATKTGEKDK